MTPFLTSLLFGIGVAGWIWSQVARRTGSADPKSTLMTAAGAGVAACVVLFTFLKFVLGL